MSYMDRWSNQINHIELLNEELFFAKNTRIKNIRIKKVIFQKLHFIKAIT